MTELKRIILQRIEKEIQYRTEAFRKVSPNDTNKLLREAGKLREADRIKFILIDILNQFDTNH